MPLDDRHIVHKGRGATFNPRVRFESIELDPFDDGWGSLAAGTRRRSPAANRSHARRQPQRDRAHHLSGPRVRPVDQPLPRLRARLRVLLRATDARLPRAVAGARLRDQTARQVRCGEPARARARQARLRVPADRARHQYRPVPAGGAAAADHPWRARGARALPASAHDRHQIGRGGARPRSARADGAGRPGAGRDLGDQPGWRARAPARAARRGAASAPAGDPAAERRRRADRGHGRADHPGADRSRDRADPGSGRRRPARPPPATSCCACRTRSRSCSRAGSPRMRQGAPSMSFRWCASAAAASCTTPPSAGGCAAMVPMRS